jgi:hypothetical protein
MAAAGSTPLHARLHGSAFASETEEGLVRWCFKRHGFQAPTLVTVQKLLLSHAALLLQVNSGGAGPVSAEWLVPTPVTAHTLLTFHAAAGEQRWALCQLSEWCRGFQQSTPVTAHMTLTCHALAATGEQRWRRPCVR